MIKQKEKSDYICSECGYESPKWVGKCPNCDSWNSFVEHKVVKERSATQRSFVQTAPRKLSEVPFEENFQRVSTGIAEFDRVLGGGVVSGSLVLIGGAPGIGKSTLLMTAAGNISKKDKILYCSGEESPNQLKLRSVRLKIDSENFLVLSETNLEAIIGVVHELKPKMLIIDSIQTVYMPQFQTSAGSIAQLRESTSALLRLAKDNDILIFIVGHITKEGAIAGPKILEHIVDTVLYFEGESARSFRILRSIKNRFGAANEIGIFEMLSDGLKEVTDPNNLFLSERGSETPGSVITVIMEGSRPLLVELQALVGFSTLVYPRRVVEGLDYNKVSLIAAVLEKVVGLNMKNQEIYLKVAGGLRISEPALDLAIASSVASSFKNKVIHPDTVIIGEVGLSGNVRAVSYINQRLKEALRSGFKKIILPYNNKEGMDTHLAKNDIQFNYVKRVAEVC